jgi:hypothetical protein
MLILSVLLLIWRQIFDTGSGKGGTTLATGCTLATLNGLTAIA